MTIPYEAIKRHYEEMQPWFLMAKKMWVSPYHKDIDFMKLFTPIETCAWFAIRGFGLLPMYPQYPIESYWVDFANPHFKIILECDGKEFHKDKDKDKSRDTRLKELGWRVFRINGADCNRDIILECEDFEGIDYDNEKYNKVRDFYMNTIEGLVRSLAILARVYRGDEIEHTFAQECLQKRCTNDQVQLKDYDHEEYGYTGDEPDIDLFHFEV